MFNELFGYEINKIERLAKGLYLAICTSKLTGVNSARIVSIPLEHEREAMVSKDCAKIIEFITKAAYQAIILNYDDSDKCETIDVFFTDEVYEEIDAWCKKRNLSTYALFRAVNLFLCDPINEECILRLLKSIELGNGAKAYEIDLEK
jgi:hypothetical protein